MKKNYFPIHLLMASIGGLFWGTLCRRDSGRCLAEKFIHPRFLWIPYLTLFIFLAITLYFLHLAFSGRTVEILTPPPWFLLIPLLLLHPALKAQPGSDAVKRRGDETVLTETNGETTIQNPTFKSQFPLAPKVYSDGLNHISHIVMNDQTYQGEEVEIIGQAAFSDRLPEGAFYLFRFIIICCAADAVPTGLIVTGYDGEDIKEDGWYRVKGKVGYLDVEGKEYVSLDVKEIIPADTPDFPYENLN